MISARRLAAGAAVALVVFVLMGTVAALWENPFFVRMTPAGGWEIGLLAALALLSGLYVVVRRPFCSNMRAGVGGVFGFLGVACPVCNKVLVIVFGGELLLAYYEPMRVYLAGLGVAVTAWAVLREWRRRPVGPTTDQGMPPLLPDSAETTAASR